MPLYRSMRKRENFAKPFGVLNISIVIVILAYVTIGFLGYRKYGSEVMPSVTLSLPNEPIYAIVQLMYALAIGFSYLLQMYVAINIAVPAVRQRLINLKKSDFVLDLSDYIGRAFLVTITFVLAASIPELDLVMELVGALVCSLVAIIIPTILHLVTFNDRLRGLSKAWLYFRNITIILIGLMAFLIGTYFSVMGIVERLSQQSAHHSHHNQLYSNSEHLVAKITEPNLLNVTLSSTLANL
ncbi:hypothetical protein NH340_JMT07304 [Sarcoptes scabiei]|uniref:Proton-coupled amino acid transporter 1-like protein n=1 Tax=Sarcoptes scabiei TaxID=52283 RepID=A0A131ZTQ6_SARSC|nr:proton-coupled amino acid transporter 1-like protein [Sarcoptes scabiei]UXI21361.1 hypothetical protein NH340_JMT07304 [Sarcoptes scabiei]